MVFQGAVEGMQDLRLHFFFPVNLVGVKAGVADEFFGDPPCHVGTGNHGFRLGFLFRDYIDAGVCPEKADVVGVPDTAADFLVEILNLFPECVTSLPADIGNADKYIGEKTCGEQGKRGGSKLLVDNV